MNLQDRGKRALDIGDAAANYPPGPERDLYIDRACGSDPELKQQVFEYIQAGENLFQETTAPGNRLPDPQLGKQNGSPNLEGLLARRSSAITPGTFLGPYEIIGRIGEGGMGEVYKARDTRLGRFVALKVSKTEFTARFALEARAAALLNHSNICTLYDVGPNYLVMEYIEGSPLAGPTSLDNTLRYAIQICSALDAAHRRGITHRDLKPDNVMVTKSGVKLLDFGLAKFRNVIGDLPSGSPIPQTLTGRHEIVGTLSYMSPEQLRGKSIGGSEIDNRSDIFSFGLVLYELLTGKRLYDGEVPADIIAAILERPAPSISHIASPSLDRVFQRCLQKDPDERWQTARDLKAELEWIASSGSGVRAGDSIPSNIGERPAAPDTRSQIARYALWTLAAAAIIGLVFFALSLRNSAPVQAHVTRTTIPLPDRTFVIPAVSRDGTRLLYGQGSGQGGLTPQLWIRSMDQLEGHPVPGTEDGMLGTFSPDGNWIAFFKGPPPLKLAKIPVNGGNPVILSSSLTGVMTVPYWADDDSILAGSEQGLVRISASGTGTETLTRVNHAKNEIGHFEPVMLPGARGVIFTVATGTSLDTARDSAQIGVLDLKSHSYEVLDVSGSTPRYVPTGQLLYRRGSTLFALPFDASSMKRSGSEAPVLDGLTTSLVSGASPYSFSQSGLLVYRSGNETKDNAALVWVDRKGIDQAVSEPAHPWQSVMLSPDGRRAIGDIPDMGEGVVSQRAFTYDFDRGILARLTSDRHEYEREYGPIWTRDGTSVTFGSLRAGKYGLYQMPADSSKSPQLLLATETMSFPSSWSPDGKMLLFYQFEQWKLKAFVSAVLPDGKLGQARRFHPDTEAFELQGVISPDGKWAAYASDHSGRFEVYVSPFPGPGGEFPVSTNGGGLPRWSSNGRELFYVESGTRRLMAVQFPGEPTRKSGKAQALFAVRHDGGPAYYDVAPDGKRFLVLMEREVAPSLLSQPAFIVVTNWFEELSRRASARR